MRLLINAVGLRAGGGLTVGLNCLRGIRQARPDYDIMALVPADHGYEEVCAELRIVHRAFTTGGAYQAWRVWFDQVHVPIIASRWSADVLFSLNNQAALLAPCPQVVLFHNPYYIYPVAQWWSLLSPFERASLLLQRWLFSLTAPRCARVAAQTQVAARRLEAKYGIEPDRIAVVASAVAPEHHARADASGDLAGRRMRQAAAGRAGILTLARYYPHKDLEFIVRVARRLREAGDRRFVFFITIGADQHPGARALLASIERERLSDDIVNLGPLAYDQLRSAYHAARVCFVPSVLESMSGAYLEALQYRLPIVTTDLDFARESCGAAAEYFPPGDVDRAIERLRLAVASPSRPASGGETPSGKPWVEIGTELAGIIEAIPPRPPRRSVHVAE